MHCSCCSTSIALRAIGIVPVRQLCLSFGGPLCVCGGMAWMRYRENLIWSSNWIDGFTLWYRSPLLPKRVPSIRLFQHNNDEIVACSNPANGFWANTYLHMVSYGTDNIPWRSRSRRSFMRTKCETSSHQCRGNVKDNEITNINYFFLYQHEKWRN